MSSRTARRKGMAALSLTLAGSTAFATGTLPTGGNVVAGQAGISQAGSGMTITQSSNRAAIDWQGFSIGQGNTVNFVQPSRDAVALNRVLGPDASTIQGALKANGQVFLVNPNGILFSPTAQVNVGGLVASTLNITNDDFLAGRYQFAGGSTSAIVNQGRLQAANGGNIALIAAKISNAGTITADAGNVLLGAGSSVLLDFGGPVKLQVQQGALDALIDNGGAIRADGGTIYLSAKAAGDLASTVINNTGIVQARTLATGEQGQIVLLGDMEHGRIHVGGTLDASAPNGGNGGSIETSGASVNIDPSATITTLAPNGITGQWLIDPYDVTVAASGGDITGATLSSQLNTNNITIDTRYPTYSSTSGAGDITINDTIAKTGAVDTTLTLRADHNIVVNSPISSSNSRLGINLLSGNAANATTGGVNVNANLTSNGGDIAIGGGAQSSAPASYSNPNGIGYALNIDSTHAGVIIGTSRTVSSASSTFGGGSVTINGKSTQGPVSGNYSPTNSGVYIMTGGSIDVGTGRLYLNGESVGSALVYGVAFQGGSNSAPVTYITGLSRSSMFISATNYTGNVDNHQGSIQLANNGTADHIDFRAPTVADWFFKIDGTAQNITYALSSANLNANAMYGGTMTVPAANSSYTKAVFEVGSPIVNVSYVFANGGTKVYDGNTTASGLTYTTGGANPSLTVGMLSAGSYDFLTPSKNVGSYSPLIAAPGNAVSYTSGGTSYVLGYYSTAPYTITPKVLTPNAGSKVYDGNTTAAVTASGVIAGDSVSLNGTGAFSSRNVGIYTVNISNISLSGADAGNYSLSGTSASATANITARPVTVSATKTYDGSSSMTGAVTFGNLVAGEDLAYTGAVANSANVLGAQYLSSISLANGATGLASNYQLPALTAAGASNTATITPKALTVSGMTAQDKAYDGTATAALTGGVLSGLVSGETLSISGETGTFSDKNAGTGKAVSVTGVTLASGSGQASNYSVMNPTGLTAAITPKDLMISGVTAQNKIYDGSAAATLNTGSRVVSGLVGDDTVNVATTGAFSDANAGTGKTVTLSNTLSGADASNYAAAGQTSTTATITPKQLTVSGMTAQSRDYDGTATATLTGGTLNGLVGSETLTFSGQTGSFANKNAGSNKAVTVSGITLADGTGTAANYSVVNPTSLTATISPKALTVSGITAGGKVYDGNTNAAVNASNAVLTGLISGDNVSVAATGTFSDRNAGTGKTVNLSSNYSGADAANYAIVSQATTTASISPKALTITGMAAQGREYDGTTNAALNGGTLTGLVGSETLTFSGQTGAFADKNAGSNKAVTVSGITLTDGTGLASNYTVANPTGLVASITQKAVSISGITAQDKVYDGSIAASLNNAGLTISGVMGGDSVSLSATGAFADKDAGIGKTVMLSRTLTGADAGNYTVTGQNTATASITPKPLSLSGVAAQDKTYDGTTAAIISSTGQSLSGVVAGDSVSAVTTGAFADKNAGTGKTVNLASTLNGTDAGNYALAGQTTTTASITPRALTVSGITASDKTYDGSTSATVSTAGVQLAGLLQGDAVNVTASGNFADRNAGNGKTVNLASAYSGADVGNYSISGQATTTASILAKALTVSGTVAADKTYDGTTAASLVSPGRLDGMIAGDDVALSAANAQSRFAQAAPGTGITVDVNGLGLQGANAGNYRIDGTASASASILTAVAAPAAPIQTVAAPVQPPVAATVNATQLIMPVQPTPTPSAGALNYMAVPETAVSVNLPSAPTNPVSANAISANAVPVSATPASATSASAAPASVVPGSEVSGSVVSTSAGNGTTNAGTDTAAAQGGETPAVLSNRQNATQSLGAGRDVKFLNVFVVSGGIRMPEPKTSNDN